MTKKPTQARALKTRAKLMETLENLLKKQEFEHISITAIAREAGVAVGSVYSHFKDKQAFLEALVEARIESIKQRLDQSTPPDQAIIREHLPDLHSAISASVKAAFWQIRMDAHIIRAVETYIRLNGSKPHQGYQAVERAALQRVKMLFQVYRDEIQIDDDEAAARVVNYVLNIIFLEKISFTTPFTAPDVSPSEEELINATITMLYAYLTGVSRSVGR